MCAVGIKNVDVSPLGQKDGEIEKSPHISMQQEVLILVSLKVALQYIDVLLCYK